MLVLVLENNIDFEHMLGLVLDILLGLGSTKILGLEHMLGLGSTKTCKDEHRLVLGSEKNLIGEHVLVLDWTFKSRCSIGSGLYVLGRVGGWASYRLTIKVKEKVLCLKLEIPIHKHCVLT